MKNNTKLQTRTLPLQTADGQFLAHYSNRGLCGLDFPRLGRSELRAEEVPAQVRAWHRRTARALERALQGLPPAELPPLDLSSGTPFQQQVWQALLHIPAGQTRSYAEVAGVITQPKAARAVGAACGANPVPVLVPCHRVLAAGHRLGGFSAGLDWKIRLLSREGSWADRQARLKLNM